jgi:hypothetical protein
MFTTTARKLLALATVIACIAAFAGCSQNTTNGLATSSQYDMVANGSLGAGDGIGRALFNQVEPNALAFFQEGDAAYAIAEAQLQNGTYDTWYASLHDHHQARNPAVIANVPTE